MAILGRLILSWWRSVKLALLGLAGRRSVKTLPMSTLVSAFISSDPGRLSLAFTPPWRSTSASLGRIRQTFIIWVKPFYRLLYGYTVHETFPRNAYLVSDAVRILDRAFLLSALLKTRITLVYIVYTVESVGAGCGGEGVDMDLKIFSNRTPWRKGI